MAEKTTIAQQIERIIGERDAIAEHLRDNWKISDTNTLEKIQKAITGIHKGNDITVNVLASGHTVPKGYYSGNEKISLNGGDDSFELIALSGEEAVTPSDLEQVLIPGSYKPGADGFSSVVVNPIPRVYGDVTKLENSATNGEILEGHDAIVYEVDSDTGQITASIVKGTIPSYGINDVSFVGPKVIIPAGYYGMGVEKDIPYGNINLPNITVNTETGMITATVNSTSGYIPGGNVTNTLPLDCVEGGTFAPSKSGPSTIVRKNNYTLGDIIIDKIPDKYIDTTDGTATAAQIIKGTVAYVNGERLEGQLEEFSTGGEHILWAGTKEYTIPVGAVNGGTVKILTETKEIEQITKEQQHITPTGNNVITKVIVPPVSSYLDGKVDVTPDQVVVGNSYVDKNGDIQLGTMPKQEGDFEWDYEVYDKFPIEAGAYKNGEGGDHVIWEVAIDPYDNDNNEGYYYNWETVSIEERGLMDSIIDAFGQYHQGYYAYTAYILPIAGNGYVYDGGAYGVNETVVGGFGSGSEGTSYRLILVDGTFYFIYNGESPDWNMKAWIYEYSYTSPTAYVKMDGLVEALAAI